VTVTRACPLQASPSDSHFGMSAADQSE
jgi:hypothetical protein